jgi:hypothetical protein
LDGYGSNPSGSLANTYAYDSFGNLVASSGSVVNSLRYSGREFDTKSTFITTVPDITTRQQEDS